MKESPHNRNISLPSGVSAWTYSLIHANGPHLACLALDYGYPTPAYGPIQIVNTHNGVTFPDAFDAYGNQGLNVDALITPNSDYEIRFYDERGNPITYSGGTEKFVINGTSDQNGLINADWDLTLPDGTMFSGSSIRGDFYVASVRGSPIPPNSETCPTTDPPAPCGTRTWRQEPSWNDDLQMVIARPQECVGDAMLAASVGSVIDVVGDDWLLPVNYYDLAPSANEFILTAGFPMWPTTADNEYVLSKENTNDLITAFQNSRNFYWHGHSSGSSFGYSQQTGYYAACPGMGAQWVKISSAAVRSALGNNVVNSRRSFQHPYRFVFIDGCCGATGDLCTSFGIPYETDGSVATYVKRHVPPREFIGADGFDNESFNDSSLANEAACSRDSFFQHWMSGRFTVSQCLNIAKSDYNPNDTLDVGVVGPLGNVTREPMDPDYIVLGAQDLTLY